MIFPRLVCVSTAERINGSITENLYLGEDGARIIWDALGSLDVVLVGHNVSYDLGVVAAELIDMGYPAPEVMRRIFEAYEQNRIVDTMVRTMLVDIALGQFQEIEGARRGTSYSLKALALRWCKRILEKEDTWRLHYAALWRVPLANWPPEATAYAILDAVTTCLADEEITKWAIAEGSADIPDEHRQHRSAWVLHLIGGWGVLVDGEMVALVKENLEHQRKVTHEILKKWDIFKTDKHGNLKRTAKGQLQKNQKRLRELIAQGYADQGEEPPLTDKGAISTSADAARESGHPAAIAYADGASAEKLLSTYVPILERGISGFPITSNPNVLVASGRTSWTNPNWQNPPRLGGIRECVIPRKGKIFVATDLDTVELRALAQVCLDMLGQSNMAEALQAGQDLHLALAAEILGIDYAEAKKRYDAGDKEVEAARQIAKAPNFGFPGGMGPPKFAAAQIAAGQPLVKDPDAPFEDHIKRALELRESWFRRWPEMRHYLRLADEGTTEMSDCRIAQPWSGRIRGGLQYCSWANTHFQGLVADGAKLALWRLAWACYVDTTSVLYGCRIVLFLHDEVILEVPEDRIDECAREQERILCAAVQEVIKDIPITSTAVAMRRWYKGAKPVRLDGKLVPSKPQKDDTGKTKWIADLAA